MTSFKELRIVDNFYQTSSFFPMPTVLISTLAENGETNLGAYSLCFPYYVAGKDRYAMLLECRNSSNTAQHLLRRGRCALNFLPDDKKLFKEIVRLGFPGETTQEKMADCPLALEDGMAEGERPKIVSKAFQVFECTWDDTLENAHEDRDRAGQLEGIDPPYRDFNGITSEHGAHFILNIDKILMKDPYHSAIINGAKRRKFPNMPVDYGYRDSTHFWYSKFKKPIPISVPDKSGLDLTSVRYAANRINPDYELTDGACAKLVKIPRIFLKKALTGIIEEAKTMDLKQEGKTYIIDENALDHINDKRKNDT